LIEPLGFDGAKTIVDDYLREVRPFFLSRARISARSIGRARSASGTCGSPRTWCPSGTASSVARGSWSAALASPRAGAGTLIFSKEAPDVLCGMARCLWSLGALPQLMV
jgi:hypothetical protein